MSNGNEEEVINLKIELVKLKREEDKINFEHSQLNKSLSEQLRKSKHEKDLKLLDIEKMKTRIYKQIEALQPKDPSNVGFGEQPVGFQVDDSRQSSNYRPCKERSPSRASTSRSRRDGGGSRQPRVSDRFGSR